MIRLASRRPFVAAILAASIAAPGLILGEDSNPYPLCRVYSRIAGELSAEKAQSLIAPLVPKESGPAAFAVEELGGQRYCVATVRPCDAGLAKTLRESLTAEFKVQYLTKAPEPRPGVRTDAVLAGDVARRLSAAYRAAYGSAFERSEKTGLYGDYMVSADSARWAGFDPREVRADRETAARAGLAHFQNLLARYGGDMRKAALAHCAGAGTVERGLAIPGQCRTVAAAFEDAPQVKSAVVAPDPARARWVPYRMWNEPESKRAPAAAKLRPYRMWNERDTPPQALLRGIENGVGQVLGAFGELAREVAGFATKVVLWPFNIARRIISGFGAPRDSGRRHMGVDIAAAPGTPIVAPAGGWIETRFGYAGISGYRLWINHGRDNQGRTIETFYAHLSGFGPGIGPRVRVEQGQVIGYVGMTGNAKYLPVSASHLHFQVRIDGSDVDPQRVFHSKLVIAGLRLD